jgi:hypothetical protein
MAVVLKVEQNENTSRLFSDAPGSQIYAKYENSQ